MQKVGTEAGLVGCGRAERVNVGHGQKPVVVLHLQSKAGKAGRTECDLTRLPSPESVKLWCTREKELHGQSVLGPRQKVEIGIELFFVVGG